MKEPSVQSDQNESAWRRILQLGAGCAAATVLVNLTGRGHGLTQWVAALGAGWAWYAAVRLLLLRTRLRVFWIVCLALGLFFLLIIGDTEGRFVVGLLASIAFLTFRLYRPYRALTSYRRIALGLMSLLFIVVLPGRLGLPEGAGGLTGFIHALGLYAAWSLKVFFGFTIVHLFFGMHLHFLHLKPKLAVTAFFLAAVPLALLALFAIITLVNFLERDRAAIATRTLEAEAVRLVQGGEGAGAGRFTATGSSAGLDLSGPLSPPWVPTVMRALEAASAAGDSAADRDIQTGPVTLTQARDRPGPVITIGGRSDTLGGVWWAPVDTTLIFQAGRELWVLDVRGVEEPTLHLRGRRVDEAFLDEIATRVGSDLQLRGSGEADADSLLAAWTEEGYLREAAELRELEARLQSERLRLYGFREPQERSAAVPDSVVGINLGLALIPCLSLNRGRLVTDNLVLYVTTTPLQLLKDLTGGGNVMNQVLLVTLISVAILFLTIELGALFLGIRITRGVTSAVSVLHAGTRRLAGGDLDTRIDIPNQDEFGDLAASFNEMTVAVKRGREEALARERMEKELETARSIQQTLLPHAMPAVTGFEFAATSIPSRQVGGDYFDFIETGEGRIGVAIADVSGKGIPAALLMANLQAALQGQVIHPGNVAAVVSRVNNLLVHSSEAHMYATFFYGVLERGSGRFTYCNAGHNPPVLLRSGGAREFLTEGGIVVGMMSGIEFEEATVTLEPGDVVVLYTDGITEAVGPETPAEEAAAGVAPAESGDLPEPEPDGEARVSVRAVEVGREVDAPDDGDYEEDHGDRSEEDDEDAEISENMFGEERLYTILTRTAGRGAVQIRDAILSGVTVFSAGLPQSDDLTVVVFRRLPDGSGTAA